VHTHKLLFGVLCAVALAVVTPPIRDFFLRTLGHTIVVAPPRIESCDVIVLAVDVNGAGVLTAADLVQQGVASRVAVFADPPDAVDREFLRRGVPYYDAASVSIRELSQLGIRDLETIPRAVNGGSEDEGKLLPEWCDHNHITSFVLVVNMDHGRRLQRILGRAMAGHRTKVIIDPTRYGEFDPDAWWKTRDGARSEIVEFEKLVLDFVRHPAS
jgi:hypothetical protein